MTRDDELARLAEVAARPSLEGAVETARELLYMDVAYVTEFTETEQLLRVVRGDGASFGLQEGLTMSLEQTYCQRILAGELPGVITDVRADPVAGAMAITDEAEVGCFASVPLRFADDTFYGTLCVASHNSREQISEREVRFLEVFARMIADQIERDRLAAAALQIKLQEARVGALAAALDARDNYTGKHSRAVVEGASSVAGVFGLDPAAVGDVEHVALLHDIGKIAIPDSVLQKPTSLDRGEWNLMRRHPIYGERLVAGTPGLEHLAGAIRAEHERWDGMGYPDGLAGEDIPLASRIVFVCDAYNAMCSDRPYRRAISFDLARIQVADGLGSQFCPTAGGAFLEVLERADTI